MNRRAAVRSAGAVLPLWLLMGLSLAYGQAQPADSDRPRERPDAPVGDLLTSTDSPTTRPATAPASDDPIARIRDEGLNRSQVMQTLSYLTDVIGPRLTGSPNLKRANEWTRDTMASWGMVNAQVEQWGQFGRGWSLKRFSAQVIEPQAIPLIGQPKAWSAGVDSPLVAEVVHLEGTAEADLEKYRGKLRGAVVLSGPVRDVQARFEPPAVRVSDTDLLRMANADPAAGEFRPGQSRGMTGAERRAAFNASRGGRGQRGGGGGSDGARPTTEPTTRPARPVSPGRLLTFLMDEGAALVITPSSQGDGGTFFVGGATVPAPRRSTTGPSDDDEPATGPTTRPTSPRPWSPDAPPIPPQVTLAAEDYNRMVRMIRQGERLRMAVDLQVEYHTDDLNACNTVAEIPGTDLKDEVVMLGAHLDSWHAGTGATDNAAGVAAVMEAARILKALDLKPRRTIRVGLWTGEEQGLLGSRAYVAKHFGAYEESTAGGGSGDPATRPEVEGENGRRDPETRPAAPTTRPGRTLIRKDGYERFSVYFNLDNGTGKIRGVYMQGNESARPLFRRWLAPLKDLGAETLTLSNTGGTDHLAFDAIGLPGFQFIQDPVEYWSRTHHSNADVYDRAIGDDLKQASTVIAAFAYQAATMDERFPRKPLPDERRRQRGTLAESAPPATGSEPARDSGEPVRAGG